MISFGRADPFGIWGGKARELLQGPLERFQTPLSELEEAFRTGNAVLWLAAHDEPFAAMVTRRDGSTMEVWLAGGGVMNGCVPFLGQAEREAREFGMKRGRITGRKGWARVLRPYGWRVRGEDLVKDFR